MKIVLRIDDVAHNVDKKKYELIFKMVIKYNIPTILGIIPCNMDKKIICDKEDQQLGWDAIKEMAMLSNTVVAIHGYKHIQHQYKNSYIANSSKSEFSGLSFEDQFVKLKKGYDILIKKGIFPEMFMAPSHGFDFNTLDACRRLGIKKVTDGYGTHVYKEVGVTMYPQMLESPLYFVKDFQTICVHPLTIRNKKIQSLSRLFEKQYKDSKISLVEFLNDRCLAKRPFSSIIYEKMINLYRKLNRAIYK